MCVCVCVCVCACVWKGGQGDKEEQMCAREDEGMHGCVLSGRQGLDAKSPHQYI